MVRVTIIALLAALFVAFGCPDTLSSGPYLARAVAYSLFHGNLFHFLGNGLAIWAIYRPDVKTNGADLVLSFLIAVLVYPLGGRLPVGFSNVIYATVGLRTPPLKADWWTRPQVQVFLLVTSAMTFVPSVSASTHICALLAGVGLAYVRREIQTIEKDVKRYSR